MKSIKIPDHAAKGYRFETELNDTEERILDGLGKVNVFIGPNNSGKSRLLRSLFHDIDGFTFQPNLKLYPEAINFYRNAYHEISNTKTNHQKFHSGFHSTVSFPLVEPNEWLVSDNDHQFSTLNEYLSTIDTDKRKEALNSPSNALSSNSSMVSASMIEGVVKATIANISKINPDLTKRHKLTRVYIPTLRGLRRLVGSDNTDPTNSQDTDLYATTTQQNYFPKKETSGIEKEIFTGYSLYFAIQELKLGSEEDEKHLAEFEDFLSEFFNGKKVSLNARKQTPGVVWIKVGEEKAREIYNLGDGLQHLIIMLFPLFQHRTKKLVYFIEELELFLHPGMQRALINSFIGDRFPHLQVFIATHSNHLLDMTLDYRSLSVYRVNKVETDSGRAEEPEFLVKKITGSDTTVLGDIGVKNSSVFLTNCTVWVEGVTDRLYIRKCIELLLKTLEKGDPMHRLKEDIHYSFVEYGGANMSHWSLLPENEDSGLPDAINIERLCGPAFLVMDNDGKKKDEIHNKIISEMGSDRVHRTLGKEIENSISATVLAHILFNDLKKLATPPTINEIIEQIIVLSKGTASKLPGIGYIFDQILTRYGVEARYTDPKYKTGAIRSSLKKQFFESVIEWMDKLGEKGLSEEAKLLTTKILNFIQKQNV